MPEDIDCGKLAEDVKAESEVIEQFQGANEGDLTQFREKETSLTDANLDLQRERDLLELADIQDKIDNAQEADDEQKAELERALSEENAKGKELAQWTAETASLREALDAINNTKSDEYNRLYERWVNAENEVHNLQNEWDKLDEKSTSIQKTVDSYQKRIDELKQELGDLEKEKDLELPDDFSRKDAEQSVATLEAKVDELEKWMSSDDDAAGAGRVLFGMNQHYQDLSAKYEEHCKDEGGD